MQINTILNLGNIMDIKKIFFVLLLSLFSLSLLAADLRITTNKKNYYRGEEITLSVILEDSHTIYSPNLKNLYEDGFILAGSHKKIKSNFINGSKSLQTEWIYYLKTKQIGDVNIAEISLQLDSGTITSKPIKIYVSDKIKQNKGLQEEVDIKVEALKKESYIGENLIYKVRIRNFIPLYEIEIEKPASDGAIIKRIEKKEKSKRIVINGKEGSETTYYYRIIPIKFGTILISPFTLKGKYQVENQNSRGNNSFGNFFSFSETFKQYRDFAISTKDKALLVKKAQYTNNKWFPAESFKLEYNNDLKKPIKVGDPISISIKAIGYNLDSASIPNIMIEPRENYKIYPEKVLEKNELRNKKLISSKIFNFTLIANRAGEIVLPVKNISWWDVKHTKRKKLYYLN